MSKDWADALAEKIIDDVCTLPEHVSREVIANRLRIVQIEAMRAGTAEAEAIVTQMFDRPNAIRTRQP